MGFLSDILPIAGGIVGGIFGGPGGAMIGSSLGGLAGGYLDDDGGGGGGVQGPGPAELKTAEAIEMAMGISPQALGQSQFAADLATTLAAGEADPRFARLVDEQEGQIKNDYIQAINMIQQQNRRERFRGGGRGSINPERQDEIRSSALMAAFEDSRSKARTSARNLLTAAADANNISIGGFTSTMGALTGAGTALAPSIGAQDDRTSTAIARELDQRAGMVGIGGQLGGLIPDNLFSGFAPGTSNTVSNNPTTSGSIWT